MRFKPLIIFFLLAAKAHAIPKVAKRATTPTDIEILNYALTLEFLENAFYSEALGRFNDKAFQDAGLNRSLFLQIAEHEKSHVQFLQTALGDQATKACNYSFPYSTLKEFTALSMVLEGVGVSAYLGAAAFITNKQYLTAAGAILTTESRHNAWVSSVANGQTPWSGSLDTPLGLDGVYSLAVPFITGCPPSNPVLPVKAFPALNVTTPSYTPGSNITLNFNDIASPSPPLFVAFLNGLTPTFAPYDSTSKSTMLPTNLTGTVYAIVTSSKNITDDATVAGPAILMLGGTEASVPVSTSGGGSNASGNGSGSGTSGAGGTTSVQSYLISGVLAVMLSLLF